MSTDLLVLAVALFAAAQAFGVGELIDVGIIASLGMSVFWDLAHMVQITVLATTENDLDEAAGYLSSAIVACGVAKFISWIARFIRNSRAPAGDPPGQTSSTKPSEPGVQSETSPPRAGSTSSTPRPRGGETSSTEDQPDQTPRTTESPKTAASDASVRDKLNRYLLNPEHPIGKSKAAWFKKALGFTRENSSALADQIKFNPETAVQTQVTTYGTKFEQTIDVVGANGSTIPVKTVWIVGPDGVPKLVTAIPGD